MSLYKLSGLWKKKIEVHIHSTESVQCTQHSKKFYASAQVTNKSLLGLRNFFFFRRMIIGCEKSCWQLAVPCHWNELLKE